MKTANMMVWCDYLATTEEPQVNGTLVSDAVDGHSEPFPDGQVGYCCLGIGEKLANPQSPYLVVREYGLPSTEFIEWLGIYDDNAEDTYRPTSEDGDGADPTLDGCRLQSREGSFRTWTCSTLNDDAHLTFPQIADMVRYFGLVPMRMITDEGE